MPDNTPNMIDFEDIVDGTRHVEMPWLDRTLEFDYAPGAYSNPLQAQFNKTSKLDDRDPRKLEMNDVMIVAMLRWWNLRDGPSGMKSIGDESVKKLPVPMKGRMVTAMMKDMGLGEADESRTSSPQPSRETAGESRNGTESSAQLEAMA